MLSEFKVLSFAIVASLYIFLVPSTSQAKSNYKVTHTPGETVGVASHSAIPCGNPGYNCTPEECEDKFAYSSASKGQWGKYGWRVVQYKCGNTLDRCIAYVRERVGLGYVTRYLQSTGGYCYYYKGGQQVPQAISGPNTWRYDPQ